jgi:hypothetical protein
MKGYGKHSIPTVGILSAKCSVGLASANVTVLYVSP